MLRSTENPDHEPMTMPVTYHVELERGKIPEPHTDTVNGFRSVHLPLKPITAAATVTADLASRRKAYQRDRDDWLWDLLEGCVPGPVLSDDTARLQRYLLQLVCSETPTAFGRWTGQTPFSARLLRLQ